MGQGVQKGPGPAQVGHVSGVEVFGQGGVHGLLGFLGDGQGEVVVDGNAHRVLPLFVKSGEVFIDGGSNDVEVSPEGFAAGGVVGVPDPLNQGIGIHGGGIVSGVSMGMAQEVGKKRGVSGLLCVP